MIHLLFEIGTEELPASYIGKAILQMEAIFKERLNEYRLSYRSIKTTGTPRRLVLFCYDLAEIGEGVSEEVKGPPKDRAFDANGNPSQAASGFARSQGVDVKDLVVKEIGKGAYLFACKKTAGIEAKKVLPEILTQIVKDRKSVSFPKSMKWSSRELLFARPIRWLLSIYGKDVIPIEIPGVKADRCTYGHPFLNDKPIQILEADWEEYQKILREHKVVVDFDERKNEIKAKILSKMCNVPFQEETLLEEVTNLVEFPNILEGTFDEKYLSVPDVVLAEAMKRHQRYFPVPREDGRLSAKFLTVFNRDDHNADIIRKGNERVLAARLADAEFFWNEDRKKPLASFLEKLKDVVYQDKLGTMYDKVQRVISLTRSISDVLGIDSDLKGKIEKASELSKCDLMTEMVGEFPDLQGAMGKEYAINEGYDIDVAEALLDQYKPRFQGDSMPLSNVGAILSMSDKLDTIVGAFSIGIEPTGSGDPLGLRRVTLGVLKIIIDRGYRVSLPDIIEKHGRTLPRALQNETNSKIINFIRDRWVQNLLDEGHPYDLITATVTTKFDDVIDYMERLKALEELSKEQTWEDLVRTVERARKIGKRVTSQLPKVDPGKFQEKEEKELWTTHETYSQQYRELIKERKYVEASRFYHKTYAVPIHSFFDKVYVDVEDDALRLNRIAMLSEINALYTNHIADLSKVVLASN